MLSIISFAEAIFNASKDEPVLCVRSTLLMTVSNRSTGQEVCVKGAQNKIETGQKHSEASTNRSVAL